MWGTTLCLLCEKGGLMTNKDKDIIRLARQSGATETYTRMIFETILEEQRTLEKLAQGHSTGAPDAL
jgi:hypothetical protein